jgi:hypothetical protein
MTRKSTGVYPPDWDEIARATKDEADWNCIRCGHAHDPKAGYTLTVHHLDLNPANCAWWNIPALCQRCHLRIQNKVVMERRWMFEHSEWFRPYVAGYYAHLSRKPETKTYVLAHLDDLLALEKTWI